MDLPSVLGSNSYYNPYGTYGTLIVYTYLIFSETQDILSENVVNF